MEEPIAMLISLTGDKVILNKDVNIIKEKNGEQLFTVQKITDDNKKLVYVIENNTSSKLNIVDSNNNHKESSNLLNQDRIVIKLLPSYIFCFFDGNVKSKGEDSFKTIQNYDIFVPSITFDNCTNKCNSISMIESVSQIISCDWNFEERELLKKSLLSFGYGRWAILTSIFREHSQFGIRVKSESELSVYADSFLRSIADNLDYEGNELKSFIWKFIREESKIDLKPILIISAKDWDLNSINQRSKPWAKRIQVIRCGLGRGSSATRVRLTYPKFCAANVASA